MVSALAALLLSSLISLMMTPVVRRWAVRRGVVDQPGGRRIHSAVTPRLGGVGVIFGFFTPLALLTLLRTGAMQGLLEERSRLIGLIAGGLVVGLIGAIDDIRGLGPWPKLMAQVLAAGIAYVAGYRIETVNLPFVGDVEMGLLSLPITMLWFLGITNAINLIDGLDGLAAGIALFAAISNLTIAFVNGSQVVVLLSASLAGALLGFLRYNFNPATIFLGDAGSMFLGFVLAATSITGAATKSSTAIAILAPIIALGIPIVDTMLTMIRRTIAGESLFAADRGHIHHRMLDLGLTHRRAVLTLYGMSILLAASAIIICFGRSWQLGAALAFSGGVIFFLVRSVSARHPVVRALDAQVLDAQDATVDEASTPSLATFGRRIDLAILTLERCADYASIERCLAELAADAGFIARIGEEGSRRGSRPSMADGAALIFELRVCGRPRRLEFDLCKPLAPLPDVQNNLARVAKASEEALHRVLSQMPRTDLLAAQ